jgi:hypothetical protein
MTLPKYLIAKQNEIDLLWKNEENTSVEFFKLLYISNSLVMEGTTILLLEQCPTKLPTRPYVTIIGGLNT